MRDLPVQVLPVCNLIFTDPEQTVTDLTINLGLGWSARIPEGAGPGDDLVYDRATGVLVRHDHGTHDGPGIRIAVEGGTP